MLIGETTDTNFIVFVLTRLRFEPTIYRTRGKHVNHYTTDMVIIVCNSLKYDQILLKIVLLLYQSEIYM